MLEKQFLISSYTLVFIHMPKAAGSTLQSIIDHQYRGQKTFDIDGNGIARVQDSIDRLRSLSEAERAEIRCVKGHVPFGVGQWLRSPVQYISMLREPVARAISDYNYAVSNPEHNLYRAVNEKGMTLLQYVEMRAQSGFANLYTRLLSGCVNWDNLALSEALSQDTLESAKENVRKCAAIGITERFDESVLLFRKKLGWSSCYYVRKNVTPSIRVDRNQVSNDVRKAIEEYYLLDIELYKYCLEIFDENIQRAGSDFQVELAEFRRINSDYQQ
jgi:hypothetical protein